jgi:anthranilate synthase/aminodeoxychorismate synthase-like glutamine amidotransferase
VAADSLRVVLVDNFDSFTWNLVDEFARRGAGVEVWRNTTPAPTILARALERAPSLIVISPGPGAPADAGCCIDLIRLAEGRVPVFGVCLGLQAMVEALGGVVGLAGEIVHGKASAVAHEGDALFDGISSPMVVARYHSLAATTMPDRLATIAAARGVVMAVRHRSAPMLGVQFHPESILSPDGGRIIENVMGWATANVRATIRP